MTSSRERVLTRVSRETGKRLDLLVSELQRWQVVKNLVSSRTLDDVWTRHIADSLQLFALGEGRQRWLDLGSGGGFPGLVIACCLTEAGSGRIDLVESNQRKCAFLRHAARLLALPVTVHAERIEATMPRFVGEVDVVTARALAALPQLLEWTEPLLKTGTLGLFPKGQHVESELTESSKYWRIDTSTVPSETDGAARIVIVRAAERRIDS